MLSEALPALLFVALANATTPALALGQVPVCTTTGVRWVQQDSESQPPEPDRRAACAHGWCTGRRDGQVG